MDRLHAFDIGLLQRYLEVLRLSRVPFWAGIQFPALPLILGEGRLEEKLDLSTLTLTDRISLVQFDALFEERMDLCSSLLF